MSESNGMKPLALITGGHTGIGLGIARELNNAGYLLALVAENPFEQDTVQDALSELGSNVHYYQHDLRDVSNTSGLLDQIETVQGPIQTLISNAGVSVKVRGDMLDVEIESYDFVMDVNLKGAFFLAQEVAQRMVKQADDFYRSTRSILHSNQGGFFCGNLCCFSNNNCTNLAICRPWSL